MNRPLTRELMNDQYDEGRGHEFFEIPDSEVDEALNGYDNAEYARCLIESDPANEHARNILANLLDFCDAIKSIPAITIGGATLNLTEIRLYAYKAGFADAYAEIEKGNL